MKTPATLTLDRPVTCACERALQVPVGLEPTMERAVYTCLRCGAVTASAMLVRHVHHNTFEPYDRRELPLDDAARGWLASWPRLIESDRGGPFYLPATTRLASPRDLFDQAERLRGAQRDLPRGRRLREAGIPAEPPPALPALLEDYPLAWQSAALQPGDDPRVLLTRADPRRRLSSPFAIDALLRRADAVFLLQGEIASGDHHRRLTACAVAGESAEVRAAVLPALLTWLETVCLAHDPAQPERLDEPWHVAAVIDQIKRWRPAAGLAAPALERAKERIGRRDYELVRQLTETIRRIRGEPPLPVSSVPWFFQS